MLIDYPSAIFILCISAAVRWKMKCFGLGWKRKLNLVLSPWIWIFLAYQCQVSPLTNKWMYVTKFSSLDNAIFHCCNVTWFLWQNVFYIFLLRRIQYYIITQHLLCWRLNDNWYWIGRSEVGGVFAGPISVILHLFPINYTT